MSDACEVFQKDVSDTRRVIINWAPFLGSGASILSVSYSVPAALTAANASTTSTTSTNYFSGGVDGKEYTVKATMTSNDTPARVKSVSFIVRNKSNCG